MPASGQGIWLRLSFGFYLLAVLTLGFRWLSPFEAFSDRAIWSDGFVAASAGCWVVHEVANRAFGRPRAFHLALGLYLALAVISACFALDRSLAATNLLVIGELAALALLTSAFAVDPGRMRKIGAVVCAVALYTAALALIGLVLFYAGVDTGLIGVYGEQFIRSDTYARIQAGFYSPPLLGSFCIFASAVLARDDLQLPPRLRTVTQVALGVTVVLTLSRAILGFAVALLIRLAYRHRANRRVRIVACSGIAACLVAIAALSVGRLHLDPTRPSTITYEVPDPHNRREAFVASADSLGERPLTGDGPGALTGENRDQPFRAHFTPLNVAATLGLPALIALALMLMALWRDRRRPTPVATWSGLAGLAVDALAQDVEHFRHVWLMLGLADADRDRPSP